MPHVNHRRGFRANDDGWVSAGRWTFPNTNSVRDRKRDLKVRASRAIRRIEVVPVEIVEVNQVLISASIGRDGDFFLINEEIDRDIVAEYESTVPISKYRLRLT